jgi:PAS domain S-box-containing protein
LPTQRETETAGKFLQEFPDRMLGALVDSIGDIAVVMLTPEGQVVTWNAGAANLTGYRADEAQGEDFRQFFAREDAFAARLGRLLDDAARTGRVEIEGWHIRKNGGRYWAFTAVHPIRSPSGALIGFACVTRDITERHMAETALQESERRFRLLVDGVTDYAIYMLDPSGSVTNWNAGAEQLKGYTADEIVGHHLSRFYTQEDRSRGVPLRVLNIAAETGRYEGEGWRLRKDGSRFWASVVIDAIHDAKGTLIGFAKVIRDISERRAAQEALRESEENLRALINGVHDYALYRLDPNGIVKSWNSGAQRIKGYTADEVIGTHFSRFYVENDRAAGMPARALAVAEREGRYEAEGQRVRKDGSLFWANVVIDRIRDKDGRTVGFAKITRDITERRNAQLELQETQARANQAQKMEALGQLTGGVAHDFNNLLMIISGQNQVLKRAAAGNDKAARAAEAVENAIARGASLTRQLLTFSRRQTLAPRSLDVEKQIAAFKALVTATMGELTILTSVLPDTWPILADPNELELALLNLAINARDAMPSGGTLTITAENAVLREGEPQGEFVAISVADTGTGIAPDILPKVFDPFFTTKEVQKGSGLGLSQVHGFSLQSGGKVILESELGRGTRITLYLRRAVETEAPPSEEAGLISGHGTVLVLDDNPEVAQATVAMLHELGYGAEIAGDGETALAAVSRRKPLLVLADIVMPGKMDGLGVARELRKAHPDLPILLMTGFSTHSAAEIEFPVMRKPANLAEMARALRSTIAVKATKPDNLVQLRPKPER